MRFPASTSFWSAAVVSLCLAGCAATVPSSRSARQGAAANSKPAVVSPAKPTGKAAGAAVAKPVEASRPPIIERDATKGAYEAALQQMQSGQGAAAELSLREVIKGQPQLPGPYANLALLRLREGDAAEAEQLILEAIKRNGKNPEYHNLLGIASRRQGHFQQAKEAYERALQIDASYANAVLNLGILYDLYLMDLVNAKRYYQSYQKMRPSEAQAINVWLSDLEQRARK